MGEKYNFGTNQKITGEYDKSLAVTCSSGTYVGSLDDGVLSFKGVHYALPPVGKLRWHEPVPVPDSDEVFEAKYYGNACPQLSPHLPTPKSEDCLMLNIWTDPNGLNEKKPVMVLDDGRKGGIRIDNTVLKEEMELALPLRKYGTMEVGL